ncbi:type 4a pilus biogenesis protein PilO [Curtobacterium sp. YC1]|uniref:type 4a pilus biogenesis protein PilO n=1 Tax=Curtobacterium sp. YC1 TaxID=2795488 RepID=UPI0018E4E4D0|nr:type 4a pilus biogenesis protein PilO [Curtobacterium sp. YC1]QQD76022.1 type 4a pilus biogenesis protein PilO [Curtobacterium sp. YC1]
MNRNRLSLVVALVAIGAVLAGAWFLGVQPQLAQAADHSTQQTDIDATNARNRAELARLEKASEELGATKAELDVLRASVPSTPSTAALLTQLNNAAGASGVTVTAITIGDAKAYDPVAAAPASEPSPSTTATPTAEPTPSAPAPLTDPAVTGANFVVIPVTAAVKGSYDQALAFTKAVQSGQRLFLVTGIASTSSDGGASPMDDQAWSLTGSVYVFAEPGDTAAADAPKAG